MKLPLAVIDPALGQVDGHHAGFAAMLAASPPSVRSTASIWAHQDLDEKSAETLVRAGVRVERAFSTPYYKHVQKPGNPASLSRYITQLAGEYLNVHRQLASMAPGVVQCVLYHTLSWEHANALSLAARHREAPGTLRHVGLLMFPPGVDHQGKFVDPYLAQNFASALRPLAKHPQVSLHASCDEHAAAYARLVGLQEPLATHPCIVGDWQGPRPPLRREPRPLRDARWLLYVGDAKRDKGFAALPQLLARLQGQCSSQARFVIHQNKLPAWAEPELFKTEKALRDAAALDARIELHKGVWTDEELNRQLGHADIMILNYCPQAYAHKTSGLLWLAAWHRLPLLLPQSGWLTREARRLNLSCRNLELLFQRDISSVDLLPSLGPQESSIEFHGLFQPMWQWISKVASSNN